PLVKERGGTVLFECQPALLSILSGVPGVDQLYARDTLTPAFDVQVPLLSLPGIFGTTLASIPTVVPYIRADSGRVETWRRKLVAFPGFKVGISWRGGAGQKNNALRSVPLALFAALAQVEGVRLISLQKGDGTDQLAAQRGNFQIIDLGEQLDAEGAFLDT